MNEMTKTNPGISNYMDQVNYPRNTWWVAAVSGEVTREPLQRTMLDRPIVLYRTESGEAVALDDRCPHRWAPLSAGKLFGDDIECPYHGIRFGPDGNCTKIPSQDNIVKGCEVHAYPLIEKPPFVWIWMGDPARIDDYDPPADLDWVNDSSSTISGGVMEVDCNYMLIHDNLMDLTHFCFVHRDTLEVTDWIKPPKSIVSDTRVVMRQDFPERYLIPLVAEVTGIGRDRWVKFGNESRWESPALNTGAEYIEDVNGPEGSRRKYQYNILHIPTPINMRKTRYYFFEGWDFEHDKPTGFNPDFIHPVFLEDKVMLEDVQRMVDERDSRGMNYPEIKIKADTPQLHARQKLKALLDRE